MSKKLGLESKYKQFINPTKLGEYKAVMGKGSSYIPTPKTFLLRKKALSTASSVLKRNPVGRIITAIGKAVTSKPGMFGAGIGIGSNVKKENKKMGGGMMKYKTGSKDVVKGKKFVADIDDKAIAALNTAKGALSYLIDDASLGIKSLKKFKMNSKAKRLTKTEGSFSKGNAVKLSPKQKKIAAMAGNPNKIDAPDFDKLRMMKAKTGKEAKISKVMKEYKEGKLNIGKSKKKVKNKKQAIAIALSEARKKNA